MKSKRSDGELLRLLNRRMSLNLLWAPKSRRAEFLALAACGELGELANILKKRWRGDKINKKQWRAALISEAADVFTYLLLLSRDMKFNLVRAAFDKLLEVEKRPKYKAAMKKLRSKGVKMKRKGNSYRKVKS